MSSSKSPIFVVGCPRSGTTLLYHMLLSAGNFAIYRAETHVFNVLIPHFGNLAHLPARTRLIDEWLETDYFRATGLSADVLRPLLLKQARSGGDFLRTIMQSVAQHQGMNRWSECTPEHILHIPEIKREIPDAKVIHIVRDGRDVALSLDRQGWIRTLPWDKQHSLLAAGLYWEYVVRTGRHLGEKIRPDYLEVSFERLVADPAAELRGVSEFIGQTLDYDQIVRAGVGSVSRPNTSFSDAQKDSAFSPVGRWKETAEPEIATLEALIAPTLRDFNYPVETRQSPRLNTHLKTMGWIYPTMFASRHWLKSHTWLGRLSSPSVLYESILEE